MTLPARLIEGYANFRSGRYAAETARYRRLGEGQQKPTIMMIACCDSRAAPETIFDAGPGEIFVVRNVANLVPPYSPDGGHHATSAALEFAVLSLGVSHIVVMGHGRCGGIRSVIDPAGPLTHTDFIGSWMRGINDVARSVARGEGLSDAEHERHIERASIEHSLANLRTFPWIRTKESRRQLAIHGAWFDISMGELHAFDEEQSAWDLIAG
ncbi:MAG: carbonic anhydrase [Rhizobiales bacterium]|nr:carbonic anhydrase [Hyphomicrobiales bacterium]MBI3672414.1 carbonic anhydrase [Hyphomicrobiales bacterium]